MLILNNAEIQDILEMKDCIDAMEIVPMLLLSEKKSNPLSG